jgi:hypothetical protein
MKLTYFVSTIILSIFLLLFLRCSNEPTAPDTNPKPNLSGKVNQLTQVGTFPSDSCKVSILTSTDTAITLTDYLGFFDINLLSPDDSIRFILEKDGFQRLDTTIENKSLQNLDFTIHFNRIEVSGRLFELNLQGTFPFPNCEIKISTGGNDNIVQSSNDGYFKLTTEKYNHDVRIVVEKNKYETIDITVKIENSLDLKLILYRIVYYFPIKIGIKWIYDSEQGTASFLYGSHTTGIDSCELVEMGNDSSWFKIKCVFNGMTILSMNGVPTDTTYFVNTISSITFNNDSGLLSVLSTDGGYSVFKRAFMYIDNYYSINIMHPANSSGLIKVKEIDYGNNSLEYDLQLNVGLKYLYFITYPGNPVTDKLNLIDYEIP